MMNVALIGYGKMGKTIEKILIERKHKVILIVDGTPTKEELGKQKIDVAIEFSTPETAFKNISTLLHNGIATVSGTTGWLDKKPEIEEICLNSGLAFLYASNFSLGVNLFFNLNKHLAKLMKNHDQTYKLHTEEIHHTKKLDAPSGTSITLAEGIIKNTNYKSWQLGDIDVKQKTVPIKSTRIDPAPGTHIISYTSAVDDIEISHTAHNRNGFALGAVIAAEYINGKKGVFNMQDVLSL